MAKSFSARVTFVDQVTPSSNRDSNGRTVSSRTDVDGNRIANEILLALPRAEYDAVLPKLEFVRLKLHQVIHEASETLKSAYFCNSGMFSVLNVMPDGKSVEVGLIGKEGFSGTPLIAGFRTSHTRTVVQGEGAAFRIDAEALKTLLLTCPKLQRLLNRFAQLMAVQVTQVAACNRLHEVNERLARWILMTQDRVGSEHLQLTQEFLSQMLGTRRSSVTVSAGTLQKAGLISYTRGNVTILDRHALEAASCNCYDSLTRQVKEWQSQDS
jgi:CRP-like cAMP-binding protein